MKKKIRIPKSSYFAGYGENRKFNVIGFVV